jgi:hypothetical protein
MHDEGLPGSALLALVRLRGERERANDQLAIELARVSVQLGEEPLEELEVLLSGLQHGHLFQCTPGYLRDRNARCTVEVTHLMSLARRKDARKAEKLAAALAALAR